MFAAEFGTGQVLWSLLWFAMFTMWFMLVVFVFADIIRRDMSGVAKALWTAGILFFPFLGIFAYTAVMGGQTTMAGHDQPAVRYQYR